MANPQCENGHTRISNEILDRLISTKINENCWQLVLFIIRKTYGFSKTQDKISLSQFVLATQLKKSVVCRGLNRLQNMNIIIRIANDECTIYRFNKDFDTWKPLAKLLTLAKQQTIVSRIANASLAKQRHTKETTTKETLKGVCFKTHTGKTVELETANNYSPDGFSPLQAKQAKKAMERALGKNKTNRWSQMLFGSAWDFIRAYQNFQGQDYVGDIITSEWAKTMAGWYEKGETRETMQEMIIAFFGSEKAEKITITPNSVFSAHTYNSWKQGKLKKTNSSKKFL